MTALAQSDDFLAAVSRLAWREQDGAERSYGSLAFAGGRWVIADIEPHVAIRLKRVFPRLDPTQVGSFHFPDSDENRAEPVLGYAPFESVVRRRRVDQAACIRRSPEAGGLTCRTPPTP